MAPCRPWVSEASRRRRAVLCCRAGVLLPGGGGAVKEGDAACCGGRLCMLHPRGQTVDAQPDAAAGMLTTMQEKGWVSLPNVAASLGPDRRFPPPAAAGTYESRPLPVVPAPPPRSRLREARAHPGGPAERGGVMIPARRRPEQAGAMKAPGAADGGRFMEPRAAPRADGEAPGRPPPREARPPRPRLPGPRLVLPTSGARSSGSPLSPCSPTLHNSPYKIRQLTGFEVHCDQAELPVRAPPAPALSSSVEVPSASAQDGSGRGYPSSVADPTGPLHYTTRETAGSGVAATEVSPFVQASLPQKDAVRIDGVGSSGIRPALRPVPDDPVEEELRLYGQLPLHRRGSSGARELYHVAAVELAREDWIRNGGLSAAAAARTRTPIGQGSDPHPGELVLYPPGSRYRDAVPGRQPDPHSPPYGRTARARPQAPSEFDHNDDSGRLSLAKRLRPSSMGLGSSVKAMFKPRARRPRQDDEPGRAPPPPSSAARILQKTSDGIQGLYEQAKKTAHIRGKADKRRDSLLRQIRVITEAGEYRPSRGSGDHTRIRVKSNTAVVDHWEPRLGGVEDDGPLPHIEPGSLDFDAWKW